MQTQVDQNLVVMQVLNEVAARHGLACLFEEKPFDGVNGSGKHNNWSLMSCHNDVTMSPLTRPTPLQFGLVRSCQAAFGVAKNETK